MIAAVLLFLLFATPPPSQATPQAFTKFTYCHDSTAGDFEALCIDLDSAAAGEARFKRRDDDDIRIAITLSPAGRTQFLGLIAATKYLENAANYESKKRVADLGKKRMTLEMPSGRREAEFNYSEMKDVNALVTFFEALIIQEALVIDLRWALQFDRLGIPERLDQLEKILKQGHIVDPRSMLDALALIDHDENIVNYARAHARDLSEKIRAGK